MTIKLEKIPLGWLAKHGKINACGNTWAEALGVLVALNPELFFVERISYERTPLTIDYQLRHALDEVIYERSNTTAGGG